MVKRGHACLVTTTSGDALMRGAHVIKTWSTTQATVALTSAEAELVAIAPLAAEAIAIAGLLREMGHAGAVQVRAGSSAAFGICKRTGVGQVRRLDTRLLWVQSAVRRGVLQVHKACKTQRN